MYTESEINKVQEMRTTIRSMVKAARHLMDIGDYGQASSLYARAGQMAHEMECVAQRAATAP